MEKRDFPDIIYSFNLRRLFCSFMEKNTFLRVGFDFLDEVQNMKKKKKKKKKKKSYCFCMIQVICVVTINDVSSVHLKNLFS